MSVFKKDYKEIKLSYDPHKLLETILENQDLRAEGDLIVSRELGIDLSSLIQSTESSIEECEIILFLYIISRDVCWENNFFNYRPIYSELNRFFNRPICMTEINKLENFIEISGFKYFEMKSKAPAHVSWERNNGYDYATHKEQAKYLQLLPMEISETLEIIKDPSISESVFAFRKSKTILEMEKHLFAIQKPYYEDLRKIEKTSKEFETLNLKNIKRRTEVFIRHDKEAQDKEMKKYRDGLNEQQKIEELNSLLFDWLHLIQIFRNGEKIINERK